MKRLIGMVALAVVAGGLSACGRSGEGVEASSQTPIAITVAQANVIQTADQLEAGGVVASRQSASLSSRIVATIADVRVRAGDRVRTGDVLVTLDARDVAEQTKQARATATAAEQALVQARADRGAAEAEHRLATAWQTRIATLHARSSATDQERDEADARLAAATSRLAAADAGIEGADARMGSARAAVGAAAATESFATVRAPFDGLVTERLTDPGNLAAPGVILLRIESDGPRQAAVRVDEARVGYVHQGDRVKVLVEAFDDRHAGEQGTDGTVAEVARVVGAGERAFTVKVDLPSTVTARTGSFARVVFRGAPRRALLIPADAVLRHGQVTSVYVVEGRIARLRLIQTGPSSPDGVEVLAGLDAGEVVATSPPSRLSDGASVTIADSAPTGGAS